MYFRPLRCGLRITAAAVTAAITSSQPEFYCSPGLWHVLVTAVFHFLDGSSTVILVHAGQDELGKGAVHFTQAGVVLPDGRQISIPQHVSAIPHRPVCRLFFQPKTAQRAHQRQSVQAGMCPEAM